MKLSPQAIEEFQDLHERKFGTRPPPEEAKRDLLMLMRLVAATQPRAPNQKPEQNT